MRASGERLALQPVNGIILIRLCLMVIMADA
jgi:hypothetical protein